ncbi:MAG: PfaD family polyunsaturated fatty acid/polyketide biosynthesis protein [Myxococcaceae bacterium]
MAVDGKPALVEGGVAKFGVKPGPGELPLLGSVPALDPSRLGDATFLRDHRVSAAYVVGEMANGIASEAMVEAAARAGVLGVFGAAGLTLERVTVAIDRLSKSLEGQSWGINLIHSPDDQKLEGALVELFLSRGITFVSASAYLDLTPHIVRYRAKGLHRDAQGQLVVPHRVMAKVSRVEVARKFLEPAPAAMLASLVASGQLTAQEAELAALIPVADDVTAEADSGGHTDNRPLVLLLPAIQALRDEVCSKHAYAVRPRVGAAGGLATPASIASAFSMGAAYVVTGSVNQATREAGTSDLVRELLAQAAPTDVAMAPAADMFELGVKVQVLTRGTLFAVRAQRLYELYRAHASLETLPAAIREELESKFFRTTLEDAWAGCVEFFTRRDPAQLEKAAKDPKHRMALVFRAYLGQASRWANAGVADRKLDFQVWCGPAMGAFNAWVKGSVLEPWASRDVALITKNLLVGACVHTRVALLRSQGVVLPAEVEHFAPRSLAELESLLEAPRKTVDAEPAVAAKPVASENAREPIAIVGLGTLFPKARSVEEFWRLLRTGLDAVGDIPKTHWSLEEFYDADQKAPDRTYAKRGAFLPDTAFDPTEFGIPPAILEATDTSQLLALVVARMAFEDAGYGDDVKWDRSRTSVLLGVTGTQELVISLGARLGHPKWKKALADAGVDPETSADVVARIAQSYVGWQENSFPGLLGNVVAGRIANRFDLGGTNCVIDAACASSLGALHLAIAELQSKRSDMVLTGGVDTLNDIFMHMCFSKTPALSPTGDARPFSDQADGTLLGEGIGMVVLKRLSDAERDGDRVYAVIRGLGTSSDGRAKSIYAPLPSGQARALEAAYRDAGVTPRDIGMLEAHGTGTKAGDAAEFDALQKVYRADSADTGWCALGSVKSQVGHTKAAAGAAGLIKAALALHHRVIPPTLKVERPNPALAIDQSPFSIPTAARPWLKPSRGPRLAAVSSFGFGGSNFHTVLEEYGSKRAAPAWDGSIEVVALSGASLASVRERLSQLIAGRLDADALAATRESFRASDEHRVVIVLTGEVKTQLEAAAAKLASATGAFTTPDGLFYGVGTSAGSIALLFPGQGAQHVDMLRDLATVFPELLEAVEADGVGSQVYPLPTFDAAERARREAALTKTDAAQPALGAVERGLLGVLKRFGVEAKFAAGHSYGELVALHAAGVLSAADLARASKSRGSLMAGEGGDRGTMLAVLAPLADIEKAIAEEKLDVVLANRNGPAQGVLSGSRDAIARAEEVCQRRSLRCTRLNVGAAFHSPLVASASSAFEKSLGDVTFSSPSLTVISNTTAQPWPSSSAEARALLGRQLASPVRFQEVVEVLHGAGARTFVEVGPRSALTGMVKAILGSKPMSAVAIDAQSRRGALADLATALAQVAADGHAVRWTEWNKAARPPRWKAKAPRTPKLVIPLTGANYRAPVAAIPPAKPKTKTETPSPLERGEGRGEGQAPRADDRITALLALHEQTAKVHQRFLENQLAAQQALAALAGGQPAPMRALPAAPAPKPVVIEPKPIIVPLAAAPMPTPTPTPSPATVDAREVVLQAVAESTGYPRETLELKMDLEADLGIDSIKRVEILSLVSRRIPGAPAVNPEQLGGLRTLAQVVDFVDRTPKTTAPVSVTPVAAPAPTADVRATLLATVSELTGYPPDTLQLSMDLEADLGIDSIKRVEILSLLSRRIPNAPSVNPEKLGGLKTLQQVHDFISTSLPAAPAVVVAAPSAPIAPNVEATLLATVSELTGYPTDTLQLSMDLEADLGIDSIKRVEILSLLSRRIPNAPSVNPEKLSGLKTLAQVRDFIAGATSTAAIVAPAPKPEARPTPASPAVASEEVARRMVAPIRAAAPGRTAVALPSELVLITRDGAGLAEALKSALEAAGHRAVLHDASSPLPEKLGGVVVLESKGADALKAALRLARDVSPRLRGTPNAFFITVTRADGAFGFTAAGTEATSGGLGGLAKSLKQEWSEVRCRSFDVASQWNATTAAAAVLEELTTDGPTEIGLGPVGRLTLGLRAMDALTRTDSRLKAGDVVVVTGGARGVTADCARELARETGITLVLLGRSPAPEPEPAWLAAAKDEAAVKKVLLERAPAGQRPSPKQLGESSRLVMAVRDVRASLDALTQLGVKATYRQVDVRDAASVASALKDVRTLGPIRGVVHGAGVLRDKRIEDKRDDDLDQVLDPKLSGFATLLDATRTDDLTLIALFASVSGRFGRRGQADYAVANQALVSMAQAEAARRPHARVVALDWGPWAGGMVTPQLETTFRAEGVSLIPIEAGARAFVREALAPSNAGVEVVLGSGFGVADDAGWSLARVKHLDPTWPVLADHRLAGRPVVPLALVIEWFASVARRGPGVALHTIEDVRVLKGVTLDGSVDAVAVWTGPVQEQDGQRAMPIELRSLKDQVHVRALVRFGASDQRPAPSLAVNGLSPFGTSVETLYREQLFHGRSLEAIVAIDGLGEEGMSLTLRAKSNRSELLPGAIEKWTLDPLTIDGVFQALIVWTRARLGAPSLPTRLESLRWFGEPGSSQLHAVIKVRSVEGATVTSDIELTDGNQQLVARLGGYQCTVSSTLVRAFDAELGSRKTPDA